MTEPELVRFWSKVNKTATCWLWHGTIANNGYAHFWLRKKAHRAHRLSYELAKGPILPRLAIDHLCRVRHCLNPAHLEAVTRGINVRRGQSQHAINARKTHCIHGHLLSGDNLYVPPTNGRTCRTCRARLTREYRQRLKSIYEGQ